MMVFLNGSVVAAEQAMVSVFDRGFLYGDGLFETIRVCHGKPFRWKQHMDRLLAGAEFLKLPLPHSPEQLERAAADIVARNNMPEAVLRLTASRGPGSRGYSPKGAGPPTVVMAVHPSPSTNSEHPLSWTLITSSLRLQAENPLAAVKSCNKLPQVLARCEADAAGADEALLLNTQGHVAETATGNLFWITGSTVCTPPIASGILPGVTRAVLIEILRSQGTQVLEKNISREEFARVEGAFVSLSSIGLAEAIALDGEPLPCSPLTRHLYMGYNRVLDRECRGMEG